MGRRPDLTPFDKIKLVDLPAELTSNGLSISYTRCYLAALKRDIPVERSESGGRWLIAKRDLPKIIKAFSLKEKHNDQNQSQEAPRVKGKGKRQRD